MKNWPPETVRIAQAALDARDALRRLAAKIQAAGDDPRLKQEALTAAQSIAVTYSDLLRTALKGSATRQHGQAQAEVRPL